MNISELIETLQKFPTDLPVVVQSYEGGVDPVTEAKTIGIEKYKPSEWYNGVYDEVADSPEKALLIFSKFNRADKSEKHTATLRQGSNLSGIETPENKVE